MIRNMYRAIVCGVALWMLCISSGFAQEGAPPVPTVVSEAPARGSSGVGLKEISVTFSAEVRYVTASALTVDGAPAKSVTGSGAGPYVFAVNPPTSEVVQVTLGGATIESMAGTPFAGDSWTLFNPPTTLLSMSDTVIGAPGAIIQVPITAAPTDGILGVDMTITYNPAVLTAQDVTVAGVAASAGFAIIRNLNTPGTIVISMYATQNPMSGSGEIARIKFRVVGSVGTTSPLTFSSAVINEGQIPRAIDDGLFTSVQTILSMPDTAQGGPAAVVQVPISVTPGDGILGVDLTITYDYTVVHAQAVTVSGIGAAAGFQLATNLNTNGVIVISTYASGNPLSGSGEFLRIQFLVVGTPGNTSNLTFTSASINEGQISATLDHGLFSVTCAGVANGTACNDGDNACTPTDTCQGGVCVGTPLNCDDGNPCTIDSCTPGVGCLHTPGNAGAVCRAAAGTCDVAESCTGTSATCPADGFQASTTSCVGTSSGGACDGTDSCDGAGHCVDGYLAATSICRAAAGTCDVAESCTGSSGACPADGFRPNTTSCVGTSNGGACDGTDSCDGSGNCVDGYLTATSI